MPMRCSQMLAQLREDRRRDGRGRPLDDDRDRRVYAAASDSTCHHGAFIQTQSRAYSSRDRHPVAWRGHERRHVQFGRRAAVSTSSAYHESRPPCRGASANDFVRYLRLQRRVQSLDLAAYARLPVTMGLVSDRVVVRAECVTGNYFQVLGVTPVVGRGFSDGRTDTDGMPPVILSYGVWRRLFGGAADVYDARVELGGKPHTVVGVAPANFTGVWLEPVDVWLAVTHSPEVCSFTGQSLLSSSSGAWLSTVGRIRDSLTFEQAASEIPAGDTAATGAVPTPEAALRPLASSRRARLSQDGRMSLWLAGGALLSLRHSPRLTHQSYSTTSGGAAGSIINSYWDIPGQQHKSPRRACRLVRRHTSCKCRRRDCSSQSARRDLLVTPKKRPSLNRAAASGGLSAWQRPGDSQTCPSGFSLPQVSPTNPLAPSCFVQR